MNSANLRLYARKNYATLEIHYKKACLLAKKRCFSRLSDTSELCEDLRTIQYCVFFLAVYQAVYRIYDMLVNCLVIATDRCAEGYKSSPKKQEVYRNIKINKSVYLSFEVFRRHNNSVK